MLNDHRDLIEYYPRDENRHIEQNYPELYTLVQTPCISDIKYLYDRDYDNLGCLSSPDSVLTSSFEYRIYTALLRKKGLPRIRLQYIKLGDVIAGSFHEPEHNSLLVIKVSNIQFNELELRIEEDLDMYTPVLKTDNRIRVRSGKVGNTFVVYTTKITIAFIRKIYAVVFQVFKNDYQVLPEYEQLKEIFMLVGSNDTDKAFDKITEFWSSAYTAYLADKHEREFAEFLNTLLSARQHTLADSIISKKHSIESKEAHLASMYQELMELQAKLMYEESLPDDRTDELVKLLKTNKHIVSYTPSDNGLIIRFRAPILYYDEDMAKHFASIPTQRSVNIMNHPKTEKAMRAIFIDGTHELLFTTNVCVDYYNKELRTTATNDRKYLGNPHITGYNCWGSNRYEFAKACDNHNYVAATLQVLTALQHLNFADGTVMSAFLTILIGSMDTPCITDKTTGELLTVREFNERYTDETNQQSEEHTEA